MVDQSPENRAPDDAHFWDTLVEETTGDTPNGHNDLTVTINSLLEAQVDLEAIDSAISTIVEHDPDFSPQHIVAQVEALYLQLETLLRSGNTALLDRAISPAFRTKWDELVQVWNAPDVTSLFDAHALPHITLAAAYSDTLHDIIAVDLLVNEWETYLNRRVSQRWIFMRASSTSPDASIWNTPRCANCGAPIPDPPSATCHFCGASLEDTFFPWVLVGERDFPASELSNLVHHFIFDRTKLTNGLFAIHHLDPSFTPQETTEQLEQIVRLVRDSIRTTSDAAVLPHLTVGGTRWWSKVHDQLHVSTDLSLLVAEQDPSVSYIAAYGDDNIEILTIKAGNTGLMTQTGTTNPSLLFRFVRLHVTDIASGHALQRTCPNCGAPCPFSAASSHCPYCSYDLAEAAGSWKLDCMYPILIVPMEID
ncbi:MAG: hypothetical protein ACP5OR_06830 [Candidatus Dormibacteria bacterium]